MGDSRGTKMDYSRFLTELSAARKMSPIRKMHELWVAAPPTLIALSGGCPNPELFPFQEMNVKLKGGDTISLNGSLLEAALQYGGCQGLPQLLDWTVKLQNRIHNPPRKFKVTLTAGSQEGICRTVEMLTNIGDYVLLDKPCYAGALATFRPYRVKFLEIETDEDGTIPESLERIMSRWDGCDVTSKKTDMPRYIYTIPNGVNPTGACTSIERKRKIYKIAQKYNLLILEDDPYYFLQFQEVTPSYLSMDVDGRVIRFDSFSKTISAGLRMGMLTSSEELVDRVVLHNAVSSVHCNNLGQALLIQLFNLWGLDGYIEHAGKVATFYRNQRDVMIDLLKKYMTGLAEWNVPKAGMFLWVKFLNLPRTDTLAKKAIAKEVLFLPGNIFQADEEGECSYVRLSYSLASEKEMDQAFQRMAELIKEELLAQK